METKPSFIDNTLGMIRNQYLLARSALMRRFLDPRRDIAEECGHPTSLDIEDYSKMYERGDVAARIVSLYPEETWSQDPQLLETEDEELTEFELKWMELNTKLSLVSQLKLADTLSGIGRYGIVLLGVDDGQDLSKPIDGMDERGEIVSGAPQHQLIYLRPFDESVLKVKSLETNVSNPRCGLPTLYEVAFTEDVSGSDISTLSWKDVHWSRAVHLADNRRNSPVFGTPRMKKVFDRILDLHKVAGGSGEMFWKGGFPGLSLQTHPTTNEETIEFDKEATKEQMQAYMNGLQRYIATVGMDVKSLVVQVADPGPHAEMQLKLIATCMGVPWRIFVGSEAAHLASEQDVQTWNRRLSQRRHNYINPFILRPLVDRLIGLGVLPVPKKPAALKKKTAKAAAGYQVWWPDLNSPSDETKASVAEKQTNALAKYAQSGADALVPPFHYLTLIMKMEEDEAKAVIKAAGDDIDTLGEEEEPAPAPRAGASNPALSRNGQPT